MLLKFDWFIPLNVGEETECETLTLLLRIGSGVEQLSHTVWTWPTFAERI